MTVQRYMMVCLHGFKRYASSGAVRVWVVVTAVVSVVYNLPSFVQSPVSWDEELKRYRGVP